MSEPYIGEIRQVGFNFAPPGWLPCDGRTVNISDYDTLYSLIGTTYGGDGQITFALPDLRGRSPIGASGSYPLGVSGGAETVTLSTPQLPGHTHAISAQDSATSSSQNGPGGGYFGNSQGQNQYAAGSGNVGTAALLTAVGGSQSHENRMPYLANYFMIAVYGLYPSQN